MIQFAMSTRTGSSSFLMAGRSFVPTVLYRPYFLAAITVLWLGCGTASLSYVWPAGVSSCRRRSFELCPRFLLFSARSCFWNASER